MGPSSQQPTFPFRGFCKGSVSRASGSWSKQASMWKSLWIEKGNRIWVCAPITHQENSFQVLPRDDLHPRRTLSVHFFFPFWKQTLKKKIWSCSWNELLRPCADCEWKILEAHGVFLKGQATAHSAAPTVLGVQMSPQGQNGHWWWERCGKDSTCQIHEPMTREEKPHTEPANGAKLFRHIAKSFWIFPQYLLNIHVYSDNYALAPKLEIIGSLSYSQSINWALLEAY